MRNAMTKRIIIVAVIVCLVVLTCALAGCSIKKKALDAVDAESLTYDGQLISWDAVKHAASYEVTVNGASYTAQETQYAIEVAVDAKISVLAKADEDSKFYRDAEEATTETFTAVGPVTVTFEDGAFRWAAVSGITKYVYEQNGTEYPGYTEALSLAPVCEGDTDQASLRVKPLVTEAKHFGVWSNKKTVTILQAPTNIRYNDAYEGDGVIPMTMRALITWDEVPNATKYLVELEGKTEEVEVPQYVYKPAVALFERDKDGFPTAGGYYNENEHKSFWVRITAIGDPSKDIVDSDPTHESFTYLDPIARVRTADGGIVWEENRDATVYEVYKKYRTADGVWHEEIVTTEKNSLGGFEPDIEYDVMVKPSRYEGKCFSEWTMADNGGRVKFFKAPVLTWSSNESAKNIVWSPIDDVASYSVYVCKDAERTSSARQEMKDLGYDTFTDTMFNWTTTAAGEYYFYVKSNGKAPYSDSEYSEPIRIVILQTIDAVTFVTEDVKEPVFEDGKQLVSGRVAATYNLPKYADGVEVTYSDVAVKNLEVNTTPTGNVYAFAFDLAYEMASGAAEASNTNWIRVQAKSDLADKLLIAKNSKRGKAATVTDVEGDFDTVILNDTADNKFFLYQLASPKVQSCNAGVITWSAVENSNGYSYVIYDRDDKFVRNGSIFGTSTSDFGGLEAGLYKFYVAARGNGNIQVSSFYSSPYYLYKLAAPTGLAITDKSTDGYTLTWEAGVIDTTGTDISFKAVQYAVSLGSRTESANANTYQVRPSEILISGTTVKVRALGGVLQADADKAAVLSSDLSAQIMLYKLETPKTPTVTDGKITWSSVENAGAYSLSYGSEEVAKLPVSAIPNVQNSAGQTTKADPSVTILPNADPMEVSVGEIALETLYGKTNNGVNVYSFSVVAKPDDAGEKNYSVNAAGTEYWFESDESNAISIRIIKTPETACNEVTGELTWTGDTNVTNYCVVVRYISKDGTVRSNSYIYAQKEHNSFKPFIYGEEGDQIEMEVYGLGDNGLTSIRSLSSTYPITTLTKHAALSAADFEPVEFLPGRNVVVIKVKSSVELQAKQYGVSIGGVEHVFSAADMKNGNAQINVDVSGEYEVVVRALSGDRVDRTHWYLDSDECVAATFTVLPLITRYDVRYIRKADGTTAIEVDPVSGATGFDYKLYYYNAADVEGTTLEELLTTLTPAMDKQESVAKDKGILIPVSSDKTYVALRIKPYGDEETNVFNILGYQDHTFTIG
ncbi:MAG: hypothetical protein J6Y74_02810 [Clostridia bacterium]|nr:hypothetical protein [Clostridia bacterium]